MEKKLIIICIAVGISLTLTTSSFAGPTLYLDADTLATGSSLDTASLVTAYGTITFDGEIRDRDSDPDFNTAGASGDVFDVLDNRNWAELSWNFDVDSVDFIYGGNSGNITVNAMDIGGTVIIDFLYQADTTNGQPAGPVTLSGSGIRSLWWTDTGTLNTFAALDNITLNLPETGHPPGWIPAPGAILLGSIGVGLVGWLRRRRTL
jgi:hypothetical protein